MDHSSKQRQVATLERPLHILAFFTYDKPVWCLSDLARQTGLPKAACHRSLAALERHGFVQRMDRCYRLGTKLITLGNIVSEAFPPHRVASPHLRSLRDTTGLSVQWVIRNGLEGVYLEVYEAREPVRLYIAPGRHAPLYAGASTRLLLAFAPDEILETVLTRRRNRYTPKTPVEAATLRALVRFSRSTWFASSFDELTIASGELSAPIWNAGGEVVAAISIAGFGPGILSSHAHLSHLVTALNQTAETVSRDLGYGGQWNAQPERLIDLLNPDNDAVLQV